MGIKEKVECDAVELARQYYYQYRKFRPARIETFISKKGKWWPYFFEAADKFSRREEWDCESFVKSQFDKRDMIFPPQLKTDQAWEIFLEYGYRNKKEPEEITLAKSLLSGAKTLKEKTVKEFLSDKGNVLRFYNDSFTFDIRFFCFSKTFIEFYEENEEKFERRINIELLKIRVRQYQRLVDTIRKKLGEDFQL